MGRGVVGGCGGLRQELVYWHQSGSRLAALGR